MKPYVVRELKTANDLKKHQSLTKQHSDSKAAYVQFEKPFLYSSFSWFKDGCYKNTSQIYHNQSIYQDEFTPVIARKSLAEVPPEITVSKPQGFTYRLYHRDRSPYIKFFVEKGTSVLQHLQGTSVTGKLVANSFSGKVTQHNEAGKWTLIFSALQDGCPSVISLKIFTQLQRTCIGHFDLLITCPLGFSVIFNFSTQVSDLPEIFILQINDSTSSHNLVFSSIYPTFQDGDAISKHSGELQKTQSSSTTRNINIRIWILLITILFITVLFLIIIFIVFECINSKSKKQDLIVGQNSQELSVNIKEGKANKDKIFCVPAVCRHNFMCLFILLYIIYCTLFTFSLSISVIYLTQSTIWANATNLNMFGEDLFVKVNQTLQEIKKFEEIEKNWMYSIYNERTASCFRHIQNEYKEQLGDYEMTTKKHVDAIFAEKGLLRHFTREIQKQNFSVYLQQIQDFVLECNKTLSSIVDRFQSNFYLFIRSMAHSDWLRVPREIFLLQDGEDPDIKYLSSTQVKQFASWLEIDKADELFVARENVISRMASITIPGVPTLDSAFSAIHTDLEFGLPDTATVSNNHFYTVLSPLFDSFENLPNSSLKMETPNKRKWIREESQTDQFHTNLQNHQRGLDSSQNVNMAKSIMAIDNSGSDNDYNLQKSYNSGDNQYVDNFQEVDTNLEITQNKTSNTASIYSSLTEILAQSNDPDQDSIKFYILIAIFLFCDVVLCVCRIRWLRKQILAVRYGYPERIPNDESCKQLLEIQTGYLLPPIGESSKYILGRKDIDNAQSTECEIVFLRDLSISRVRGDPLQTIFNENMRIVQGSEVLKEPNSCHTKQRKVIKTVLHRMFMSDLTWQASVTFLAIVFICVFAHSVEGWLTQDAIRALVGRQPALADVQWELGASHRYLTELAKRLTAQLDRLKKISDSEMEILTDLYFTTINLQTSMFTDMLQKLCREAKGKNCDKLILHHSARKMIVGCNFLPLSVQTFHELSLSNMEAVLVGEVTPIINLFHHTLMVSACVAVFLLCLWLVCQVTASELKHFLLMTGRLPRVRIRQSEKIQTSVASGNNTTMQRSQSWVDSCESGVYLGEADDTNKDENR